MKNKVISIDQARKSAAQRMTPAAGVAAIPQEYDRLYAAFSERFQPVTGDKEFWLREAVSASMTRTQLEQAETNQLNDAMRRLDRSVEGKFGGLDPQVKIAKAWTAEAAVGNLEELYKQIEHADIRFHRALNKLMRLQKKPA